MIHIYYGDGKGKTSTLNGCAVRAKGANLRVAIFRFLKGIETSEDISLRKLDAMVYKVHVGTKFVYQMDDDTKEELKLLVEEMFRFIRDNKDKYDVIILDEFLDLAAHNVKMATHDEMARFLEDINDKEVLISGHTKIHEIFEMADLITFFKKEKHYFDKGQEAREGIEF